jgi:hypothetical protein
MPNTSPGPLLAIPKWTIFEKLVAEIHRAELQGAEVRWNDKIRGRQFDVIVRFTAGHYGYLTVIECRHQVNPLKVERVDAFVTKTRDVNANKGIIVSSSGFQQGCYEVARRHGIELLTLTEVLEAPEGQISSALTPGVLMHSFVLLCGESLPEVLPLPEERNILPFLVKATQLTFGGMRESLETFIDSRFEELLRSGGSTPQHFKQEFTGPASVTLPDIKTGNTLETITLTLRALEFQYQVVPMRFMTGDGRDPYLTERRYELRNVVTGDRALYDPQKVAPNLEPAFQVGKFYYNVVLRFLYHCDGVSGDLITLTMIEGYQHGKHLQVTFRVLRKDAGSYVEVTDQYEITRLSSMLATLRRLSEIQGTLRP